MQLLRNRRQSDGCFGQPNLNGVQAPLRVERSDVDCAPKENFRDTPSSSRTGEISQARKMPARSSQAAAGELSSDVPPSCCVSFLEQFPCLCICTRADITDALAALDAGRSSRTTIQRNGCQPRSSPFSPSSRISHVPETAPSIPLCQLLILPCPPGLLKDSTGIRPASEASCFNIRSALTFFSRCFCRRRCVIRRLRGRFPRFSSLCSKFKSTSDSCHSLSSVAICPIQSLAVLQFQLSCKPSSVAA